MGIGAELSPSCRCLQAPYDQLLPYKELGMDERYAQTSLLVCPLCGRLWLRYYYELEAISKSGRWYLGAITQQQAEQTTARNAKATLEALSWYFYGGSYYEGRSGKISGPLDV
jgi:hypothetical protein